MPSKFTISTVIPTSPRNRSNENYMINIVKPNNTINTNPKNNERVISKKETLFIKEK